VKKNIIDRKDTIYKTSEQTLEQFHKKKGACLDFTTDGASLSMLFRSHQNLKSFQDFPSHRILRYMHEALNIDENKN